MYCAGGHNQDAGGNGAFIADLSDAKMLEFVKTDRPVSDPLNTTGIDMPPKGGNPALTDDQILDIIAYIRTVQKSREASMDDDPIRLLTMSVDSVLTHWPQTADIVNRYNMACVRCPVAPYYTVEEAAKVYTLAVDEFFAVLAGAIREEADE